MVESFRLHFIYSQMKQITGNVPGRSPTSHQRGQCPSHLGKFLPWTRTITRTNSKSSDKLSIKEQAHILSMYFLTKQLNFLKVWFFVSIQFHYLRDAPVCQKKTRLHLTCQAEEWRIREHTGLAVFSSSSLS